MQKNCLSEIELEAQKKPQCPDCDFCQKCSESRCRLCRNENKSCKKSLLGTSFTYGQYIEWQKNRNNEESPVN